MTTITQKDNNNNLSVVDSVSYVSAIDANGNSVKIAKKELMEAIASYMPRIYKPSRVTQSKPVKLAEFSLNSSSSVISAGFILSTSQVGGDWSDLYYIAISKPSSSAGVSMKVKKLTNFASFKTSNSVFCYTFDTTSNVISVYLNIKQYSHVCAALNLNNNISETNFTFPMTEVSSTEIASATTITVE